MNRLVSLSSLALLLSLFCGGCASPSGRPGSFEFALIGDVPYNARQVTNDFPNLLWQLNLARLEFVVHTGDIKSGNTPCDDTVFEARLREFQSSQNPFIYLFGDNEWTDCGRGTNGYDPEERLARLRQLFTQGDHSLGRRKLALARQSNQPHFEKFRENIRWTMGGVTFVGLNVPGAINNYGKPEFAPRNAANLAWLRESFSIATMENSRAVMLLFQANPFPELGGTNKIHAGFREMLALIERETLAFGKPVVLVHGDTHHFRIDKPLSGSRSRRVLENFTRVETFGDPDAHWVRVTVHPDDPNVFTFRPEIVPGNVVKH